MDSVIITIAVGLMAVCAVFVTVTPIISEARDRRIRRQEKKIKEMIREMENIKQESLSQRRVLENVENELYTMLGYNEMNNNKK
jgi:hypothetical protein